MATASITREDIAEIHESIANKLRTHDLPRGFKRVDGDDADHAEVHEQAAADIRYADRMFGRVGERDIFA